jgi:hypothetical protein
MRKRWHHFPTVAGEAAAAFAALLGTKSFVAIEQLSVVPIHPYNL